MWMVGIEYRVRKGSLKTHFSTHWNGSAEKNGLGEKIKKKQAEVGGNKKCFWFLKPRKRVQEEGSLRSQGEVSTESSALATWCSLAILANVMEWRSEGSLWEGREERSYIGEVSLGRREERKVAGRGLGWDRCFLFYLKRDLSNFKCKGERLNVGKRWAYRGEETGYSVGLRKEQEGLRITHRAWPRGRKHPLRDKRKGRRMAPGKVGLQQEVEVCRSRAEICGGPGRVKSEWRGFEREETPNLVTSKELSSWAAWRRGNCMEGRGAMKTDEGRGSHPSHPPPQSASCLPFSPPWFLVSKLIAKDANKVGLRQELPVSGFQIAKRVSF